MKKLILIVAGIMLGTVLTYAQDISEAQVPSLVLNAFKKDFPKASDVEWELKGTEYNVDFEIGFADHEAWFDSSGKIVKHREEIKQSELPESVCATLKKEFSGFRISDIKKIKTESSITYEVDAKKANDEWELTLDDSGKIVNKKAD